MPASTMVSNKALIIPVVLSNIFQMFHERFISAKSLKTNMLILVNKVLSVTIIWKGVNLNEHKLYRETDKELGKNETKESC